jgi:hypothetical protein
MVLLITGIIFTQTEIILPWYIRRLLTSRPFNILQEKGFYLLLPTLPAYHYKDDKQEILVTFSLSNSGQYEISVGIETTDQNRNSTHALAQKPTVQNHRIRAFTKKKAMAKIQEICGL